MHQLAPFGHLAITSKDPIGIAIERASGVFMYDTEGNDYLDIISGIGVSNLGHNHPAIREAITQQSEKYLHLMCYGELVQQPQIALANLLASTLPKKLSKVFLVNSGSEAVEGAIKTAKRYTGRTEIISIQNAYHGSTHGSLTANGNEKLKQAYRPLLPDFRHIALNNNEGIQHITSKTAAVLIEPVLGEAGVQLPEPAFMQLLADACKNAGALLIFDEVQTGMGRTGKLWAMEHYSILPDMLITAKAMGGGLPIGAFIGSEEIMDVLTHDPILGHITTFGGHPLSCATAIAAIHTICNNKLYERASAIEMQVTSQLKHKHIKEIRSKGAMMAIELNDEALCWKALWKCYANRLITDSFLYCPTAIRFAPPLIISDDEIKTACERLLKSLDQV